MAAKPWIVNPLVLPVNDKTYTIEPVGYEDGMTLIAVSEGDTKKSKKITAKSDDKELFMLCMGPVWDEMRADNQSFPVMFRAGMAALQYQLALVAGMDPAAAVAVGESFWDIGVDPEAVAAARLATTAANQNSPTSKPSTSTGTARKTPSQGSMRTTTSRSGTPRTPRKAPAKKAAPSRGATSSASGR